MPRGNRKDDGDDNLPQPLQRRGVPRGSRVNVGSGALFRSFRLEESCNMRALLPFLKGDREGVNWISMLRTSLSPHPFNNGKGMLFVLNL